MKTGCWAVFPQLPNSVSLGWKRKMFISHQFSLATLMLAQATKLLRITVLHGGNGSQTRYAVFCTSLPMAFLLSEPV